MTKQQRTDHQESTWWIHAARCRSWQHYWRGRCDKRLMMIITSKIHASITESSTVIGIDSHHCSSIEYCVESIHQTPQSHYLLNWTRTRQAEASSVITLRPITAVQHPSHLQSAWWHTIPWWWKVCCVVLYYTMIFLVYCIHKVEQTKSTTTTIWPNKRILKIPKQWINCVSYSITLFWNQLLYWRNHYSTGDHHHYHHPATNRLWLWTIFFETELQYTIMTGNSHFHSD